MNHDDEPRSASGESSGPDELHAAAPPAGACDAGESVIRDAGKTTSIPEMIRPDQDAEIAQAIDWSALSLKRALEVGEPALGSTSYEVGYALDGLARVYDLQNRIHDSENFYRKAVVARRIHPGERSVDLADSLHRFWFVLFGQQKYADAEDVARQLLKIREQPSAGTTDLELATTLSMLARCCRSLGIPAEAETYIRRELQIREKTPVGGAAALAMALNDLGDVLFDQQKYAEAEAAYGRRVAIEEQVHGLQSRQVAAAAFDLARVGLVLRKFGVAEELLRQVLVVLEQAGGETDPALGPTLSNLGIACQKQSRFEEADGFYRRATEIYEKNPGALSGDLVWILNLRAKSLIDQGKCAQAEELLRQTLAIEEQARPANDPAVGTAAVNLALSCHELKKFAEAELLYQRALTIYEGARGLGDPATAWVRQRAATFYSEQGRDGEAEALFQKSVTGLTQLFGNEHPAVADAQCALAGHYVRRGQFSDAELLFRRVITVRRNALSPNRGGPKRWWVCSPRHRGSLAFMTLDRIASHSIWAAPLGLP